jgi:hypothetical protein
MHETAIIKWFTLNLLCTCSETSVKGLGFKVQGLLPTDLDLKYAPC